MLSPASLEASKLRLSNISISLTTLAEANDDEKGSLLPSSLLLSSSLKQPSKMSDSQYGGDKISSQQNWKDTLYFAGGVTALPEVTSAPASDYYHSTTVSSTSSSVVGLTHAAVNSNVGFEDDSASTSARETIARRLGLISSVVYALPIWSKREEMKGFLVASASIAVATSDKKAIAISTAMANEASKSKSSASISIPASPAKAVNNTKPPTTTTAKGGGIVNGSSSKASDAALAAEISDALSRKMPALSPFVPTGVIRLFHVPREVLAVPPKEDNGKGGRKNTCSDKNLDSSKPTIFSAYETLPVDASYSSDIEEENSDVNNYRAGQHINESKFESKYEDEDEDDVFGNPEMHDQPLHNNVKKSFSQKSSSSYTPPVRWVASATLPLGILAAKVEVSIDGRFLSVLCSDAHVRVYYIHPSAMTPPPPEPPRESESAAMIRIAAEKARLDDEEEEERKNNPGKINNELIASLKAELSRIEKRGPITFPPLPLPPPLELELVSDLAPPTLDSIFSSLSTTLSPHSFAVKTSHDLPLSRSAAALAAAGGARIAHTKEGSTSNAESIPLTVGFHFTASRSYTSDMNNEESLSIDDTRTVERGGSVATTSRTRGGQQSGSQYSSSSIGDKKSSTRAKSLTRPFQASSSSSSSPSSSSSSSNITRLPKNNPGHDGIPVTVGCIVWWSVDKSAPGGETTQARAAQENLRFAFRFPLSLKTLIDSPPLSSTATPRKALDTLNTLFTPLPFAPTSSCIFPNISSYHHISANATGMFPSASSPLLILGDEGGTVSAFEIGSPSATSASLSPRSMSPGALLSRGILGRHTLFPSLQASLSADIKNHQLSSSISSENESKDETKEISSLSLTLPTSTTAAVVTAIAISACCRWAVSGSSSGQIFIYDLRQALMTSDNGVAVRSSSDPLLSFPSISGNGSTVLGGGMKSSSSHSKMSGLGLVGGSLLTSINSHFNQNNSQTGGGRGGWQAEATSEAGVVLKLPCHVLAARWDGNGVVSSLRMLLDVPIAIAEVEEWPTTKTGDLLLPAANIRTTTALYSYDVPAGSLLTVLRPSDKNNHNSTTFANESFGALSHGRSLDMQILSVKPLEPDGLSLNKGLSNNEISKTNSKGEQKGSADAVVSQGDASVGALRNVFVPPPVSPSRTTNLSAELSPSLAKYALWSIFPDGVLMSTSIASDSNTSSGYARSLVHSITLRGLLRSGYPVLDRAFLRAGIVFPLQRAGSARSSQPTTSQGNSTTSLLVDSSPTEAILRSAYAAQLYASLTFHDRSLGRNVASSILAGPDAQAATSKLVEQRAIALLESRGLEEGARGGGGHSFSQSDRQTISAQASISLVSSTDGSGSLSPPPIVMTSNYHGEEDGLELGMDEEGESGAIAFTTNTNEISRSYVVDRNRNHDTRDLRLSLRAKTTAKLLGRETQR